jgi:hypothetical protein
VVGDAGEYVGEIVLRVDTVELLPWNWQPTVPDRAAA